MRATIESVAENAADGVISPTVLRGYWRTDSHYGLQSRQYAWIRHLVTRIRHIANSAGSPRRLDDLANFIPARLTGILIPVAALILNLNAVRSYRIFARDRLRHPSPNAGQAEAAMAGALGIQLGGLSYYGGEPSNKPTLGELLTTPKPEHIRDANRLLLVTSGLALALFLGIRFALTREFGLLIGLNRSSV